MKRLRTIAIVAGLVCGCVLMLAGCSDDPLKAVATLHPVEVDGQWGYMDAGGTVIVRPRFEQAGDFHEGLASVTLKTGVGFIDTTGAVVYAHDDSAGARCLSIGRFSEGLAAKMVRIPGEDPDTRVFYIDRQGETAFTSSFFGGRPFHSGLAAVQVNGMALMGTGAPEQWGYIGKDGALVIEPQYESSGDFSGGLACVAMGDRHGYIDKTGRWVLELPKGTVPRTDWSAFSAGLAAVWQGEKAGYIDRHGTMVIAPRFFDARPFAEGLAAVCKASGGLWGYIDKKGTMVIAPQFGQAEQFRGGVARVYLDRECTTLGYIDKTGKVVWQGKVTTEAATGTAPGAQASPPSAQSSPPVAQGPPPAASGPPPSTRAGAVMAYDPIGGNVLLFGGFFDSDIGGSWRTLEDMWSFDPVTGAWTELKPTGDLPRDVRAHALVYDPSSQKMILFSDGPDQPNYAYDPAANTWATFVTSGDTQQGDYSMYSVAYDSDTGKVIRFGGELVNPPESLGGTSCFDPVAKTWVDLQATGDVPAMRRLQSMVYDPSTHRVVMFGGIDEANPYYAGLDETWAYDPAANTWARVQPSGEQPPSRSACSMVRDPVSGKLILFGGQGNGYLDDTWAFDPVANTWTELDPSGERPSARVWSSMVYDPHSHRMILFGGEDAGGYRNDTWAYDPAKNAWTDLSGQGVSSSND